MKILCSRVARAQRRRSRIRIAIDSCDFSQSQDSIMRAAQFAAPKPQIAPQKPTEIFGDFK
jgi:hypothetical protein